MLERSPRFIHKTLFLTFPAVLSGHRSWQNSLWVQQGSQARVCGRAISSEGNISLVIIQPGSRTNQSFSPTPFLLKTAQREGRISVFIFGSHCVHEVLRPALSGSYSLPSPAIAGGGHPSVSPGLWQYLYLHFPVDVKLPLSRGVSW